MNRSLLRLGAWGAALSTLLLSIMALIDLPGGIYYPGLPVLTGDLPLSPVEQNGYLVGMRLLFVLDVFFSGRMGAGLGGHERSRPHPPAAAGLADAGIWSGGRNVRL